MHIGRKSKKHRRTTQRVALGLAVARKLADLIQVNIDPGPDAYAATEPNVGEVVSSTELKRETIRRCNEPSVTAVLAAEKIGISKRQLRRCQVAVERHGVKKGVSRSGDRAMKHLR